MWLDSSGVYSMRTQADYWSGVSISLSARWARGHNECAIETCFGTGRRIGQLQSANAPDLLRSDDQKEGSCIVKGLNIAVAAF